MLPLIHRDSADTDAAVWDVVAVKVPPVLWAGMDAPTSTFNCEVTLSKQMEVSMELPPSVSMHQLYANAAITALAEIIDTHCLDAGVAGFTHSVDVDLTDVEAGIDAAQTALFKSKCPMSGLSVVAGEPLVKAIYGHKRTDRSNLSIKEVNAHRSPYAADCPLVFHRHALVIAARKLALPEASEAVGAAYSVHDGFALRVVVEARDSKAPIATIDCLYGVGVMRPNFGVRLMQTVAA